MARCSTRSGIDELALATGGSLGGMVALEVALARPGAIRHVAPIAAPAAIGPMAVAWNHLQLQLIEHLGLGGLSLARQLAMTTYRSEMDFGDRFGGSIEDDGRPSIVSYLDHQGDKLVDRFDPATYRILVGAMDSHDIGRDRGGIDGALARLAQAGVGLTGIGIEGDILYGPRQVRALVDAASSAGVESAYREISSTKGHDAFLVEWDQLTAFLREALARLSRRPGSSRRRRTAPRQGRPGLARWLGRAERTGPASRPGRPTVIGSARRLGVGVGSAVGLGVGVALGRGAAAQPLTPLPDGSAGDAVGEAPASAG